MGLEKELNPPNNFDITTSKGDPFGFVLFSAILVSVLIGGFSIVPKGFGDNLLSSGGFIAVVTAIIYYLTNQADNEGLSGMSIFCISIQVLI